LIREPALGIGAVIKHRHVRKNASGAAAAEYALVLAILGAALTFGALALGTAITDSIEPSDCTSGSIAVNVDCR
jgi:Flp pilus assembly pilin Flp